MTAVPILERPIFIVAAPRSGSTLLYEALARQAGFWTLDGEAHHEFESVPGWHPRFRNYESNRLIGSDSTPGRREALLHGFTRRLQDRDARRWRTLTETEQPAAVRFLEKTPKNSLRIPLIKALFPDARFVFLVREPRGNISSLIEAWRSGRFVTYPDLPGWDGLPWSMLLPPAWRSVNGAPLERVAALQWCTANEIALADLRELPATEWTRVTYEELVSHPAATLERLCRFSDIQPNASAHDGNLPLSRHTLTPPAPDKWRINRDAVESVVAATQDLWRRLTVSL